MKYSDLRDFIAKLKQAGELSEVSLPVSPYLEMTELCDRTLRAGGPALLFKNPTGHSMPVLGNLFGTPRRVALGMGADDVTQLRDVGRLLAALGKAPLLDLGLRLGEGSGAALALGVVKGALACHSGMATFAEAGGAAFFGRANACRRVGT